MVGLHEYLLWVLPFLVRGAEEPRGRLERKQDLNRRQSDAPDVDSFRLRGHHSVAVLGGYLYIVGGEISQFIDGEDDPMRSRAVNSTLSTPLDQEWSNSSISFKTSDEGGLAPAKDFVLWVDDAEERLYAWGGEGPYGDDEGARDRRLGAFDPDGEGGGEWSTQNPENQIVFSAIPRPSEAGYATCGNTGFWLGGTTNPLTDSESTDNEASVHGVFSFDMANKRWADGSSDEFNYPYGTYNGGRAVCGSAGGSNPLLFFLGGEAGDDSRETVEPVEYFNLTFYDSNTRVWYWQRTSGDTPPARTNFCAVGVQGPDGTYETFIYGGQQRFGSKTESLSDIYVLSIPAFRWFRVNVEGTRRAHHDCTVAGGRQMIVVGGMDLSDDEDDDEPSTRWRTTDEWAQGLGVFDVHDLQWRDRFDPDAAPYEPPAMVKDWYTAGGLDNIEWSNEEVKSIFEGFEPAFGTRDEVGKPVGTIVGASVGGVVGVLAVSGLAVWLFRRQRKAARPVHTQRDEGSRKSVRELDASGYRYPLPAQELDAPRNYEALPRQELEAVEPGALR